VDKELIQSILNTSARVLHAIEIADLEAYIEGVSLNNSTYDALGPMLDPTDYRKNLHSGRIDNLKVELQIARKMLEVRKLLDQIEV